MALLPAAIGKFRPEHLFNPRSIVVVGACSAIGDQVRANLAEAGFKGDIVEDLAAGAELAVICAIETPIAALFGTLAQHGTRLAVVLCMAENVGSAARATGLRALGPGSFGIAVPKIGLNLSRAHLPPRPGRLALVSQSAALCRAVLDWAEPNGVGFSTILGVGGNADIGFGLVLDWLSRDPDTGAILLDIRHIRDARVFLSAARAAARLRPVVAIRAGVRLADPDGDALATFDAALRRCGVLGVSSMTDMLAAVETLTRARPARGEGLAIVTNAIGPAQMAADAVLRDGLRLAVFDEPTRQVVQMALPGAFRPRSGAPVEGSEGIVYAGADQPIRLAEIAALLSGAPEVGGVLLVHAPTGPRDAAGMAAITAAAKSMAVPLLVCAMGETTGAGHRRTLAQAGVPAFAAPEEAVRGFLHLVQHRRIHAAARELPDSIVPDLAIDRFAAVSEGVGELDGAAATRLLAAYGISCGLVPGTVMLRVALSEDAMFGPTIAVGRGGPPGRILRDIAIDLPPLNRALATSLLGHANISSAVATVAGGTAAIVDLLVRISQMAVDLPRIASLELDPLHLDETGVRAGAVRIVLRAQGRGRLAISPYPVEMVAPLDAKGEAMLIRPIRPEDAAAHAAFFARLSPEDVRYRFFSAIRALSTEQIARLTQVDYEREMALIAVRHRTGETVGVARLVCEVEPGEAEFAVVVQGDVKGRGVAGALMRRLIAWGRDKGVREIVGQVLSDNVPMLAFVRHLGFRVTRMNGDPDVMEVRLAL